MRVSFKLTLIAKDRSQKYLALPDPDPLLRRYIFLIRSLYVESGIPGIEIANLKRAIVARRMSVGEHLLAQGSITALLRPGLRERDEKLLVARETVLRGSGLTGERKLPRVVGGRETAEVGNVLAQGLLAVEGKVWERLIGVVLGRKFRRGGLEMGEVFRRPPVSNFALRIECAAFIVEGMADLVADHRADGTIVGRSRRVRIEKGRLQNAGREVQRVLQRKIHGIDGLRSHGPF